MSKKKGTDKERGGREEEEREREREKKEEISSILLVNTEIPFPRANAAETSFVVFTLIFDASSIRHGRALFDFFFFLVALVPSFSA